MGSFFQDSYCPSGNETLLIIQRKLYATDHFVAALIDRCKTFAQSHVVQDGEFMLNVSLSDVCTN